MKTQLNIVFGIFVAILIILSCEEETIFFNEDNLQTNLVKDLDDPACDSDPFELIELKRNGDLLTIKVAYSGGCAKHEFALLSDLSRLNDEAPELVLTLIHDGNGDLCEAYPHQTIEFDLKSIIGGDVPASLKIILEKCEE